jgi:hypothetical protein
MIQRGKTHTARQTDERKPYQRNFGSQKRARAIKQLGDSVIARQRAGDHSLKTFQDADEYGRRSDAHNAAERQRLRRTRDAVGKMLAAGRSEAEIDAFVKDSGFTISQIRQANKLILGRYGFPI